jgi:dihydrofolate synthase/folylpolyglutamate synthase
MLPAGSPLPDWLTWLETLSPREIDLGLERVQAVLNRLSLPIPEHVLLIAGTNGKGSSVAMADALLRAADFRVGAYTSPHITDYNERISVQGRHADDAEIVAAFEKIEAVRDDALLTYFEYGTLAAMVLFAEAALDVWLLEVGMGGRLDATNAIDPTGVLISNVSLDHCDWLGKDIDTIAVEKAGVMRGGIPVVFGAEDVPQAIIERAAEIGAHLLLRDRDYSLDSVPQPGLRGGFQVGNAAAVIALLKAAGLEAAADDGLVAEVLPTVEVTGRGQSVELDGIEWLLDVAHNPAAAEALAATLAADGHSGATLAIVGMLDDKDVEGCVQPLNEHVDQWIAVTANSHRAIPAQELARRIATACGRPCLVANSLGDAMESARRDASINDRILATGSFFLVGPVLERLYSRPQT